MKILMLNSEYPPLGGGQGNANKFVFEKFNEKGTPGIDIVTASPDKAFCLEKNIGNIYGENIGKNGKDYHSQSPKNLIVWSLKSFWTSYKLIRKNRYDLLVAWSGVPAGYICRALSLLTGLPYVVLLRGSDVPFHEAKWHFLDKNIFSKTTPFIWKSSAAAVANSEKLKSNALKISPKQYFEVIPNGVDTDFFRPAAQVVEKENLRFISTGRLAAQKGYQFMIEALAGLPGTELLLIGDGPMRQELTDLAAGLKVKLILRGYLPQNEIVKELQAADVFVLPSLNEGMSNALLEAMACGLPVIVTDVGGTSELTKNNGRIVAEPKPEALREAADFYLKNPGALLADGKRSRKIAEGLSWADVADRFAVLFERLIGR